MESIYIQTTMMVRNMVGQEYLYFDNPLTCPATGENLWAICVSPAHIIYVMDNEEQWYEINKDASILKDLHTRVLGLWAKARQWSLYDAVHQLNNPKQ